MSMELTPPAHTMATLTSSWSASTSTTMKPLVASMYPVLSWLTLNLVPWTPSVLDPSDRSSAQTTLFLARVVPETTGPRVTTQRELSWLTQFSMLSARRLSPATVFRDFNSPTLLEVARDLEWEPFSSPRSVRSTQTGSWTPSLWSPHPRCQTQWLSHTMPLSLSISWWRIQMRPTVSTMRLSMTSASELWSWPPQHMVSTVLHAKCIFYTIDVYASMFQM